MLATLVLVAFVGTNSPKQLVSLEQSAEQLSQAAQPPQVIEGLLGRAISDWRALQREVPGLASELEQQKAEEALAAARNAAREGDELQMRVHAAELSAALAEVASRREPPALAGLYQIDVALRQVQLAAEERQPDWGQPLARWADDVWASISTAPPFVGSPAAPQLAAELSAIAQASRMKDDALLTAALGRARQLLPELDAEAARHFLVRVPKPVPQLPPRPPIAEEP
jgi:hypothetical protein